MYSAVLPDESTAVYVTLCIPMLNRDPGLALDDIVTTPELSVALGSGSIQFTIAKACPALVDTEMLSGRLSNFGASSSKIFHIQYVVHWY